MSHKVYQFCLNCGNKKKKKKIWQLNLFFSFWRNDGRRRHGIRHGIFRLWYIRTKKKFFFVFSHLVLFALDWRSVVFVALGKKARTFDLDAIFEQTRRTAIERSHHVLGTSSAPEWHWCLSDCVWNCTKTISSTDERQKVIEMEEQGESSASVKSSGKPQKDKAANSSRFFFFFLEK